MQIQPELERYRTDALYFEQHRHEFLQRDPERWIAVYNQQVVGTAKRLPTLLQAILHRLPPGCGAPPSPGEGTHHQTGPLNTA